MSTLWSPIRQRCQKSKPPHSVYSMAKLMKKDDFVLIKSLWRDLTRVLSTLQYSIPRVTFLGQDLNPRARAPVAGTLPKSYLDVIIVLLRTNTTSRLCTLMCWRRPPSSTVPTARRWWGHSSIWMMYSRWNFFLWIKKKIKNCVKCSKLFNMIRMSSSYKIHLFSI